MCVLTLSGQWCPSSHPSIHKSGPNKEFSDLLQSSLEGIIKHPWPDETHCFILPVSYGAPMEMVQRKATEYVLILYPTPHDFITWLSFHAPEVLASSHTSLQLNSSPPLRKQ